MKIEKLLGPEQADIAEQDIRSSKELIEEGDDLAPELWEVVSKGVQVKHLLLEIAPELLYRVGPRGIGG